MKNRKQKSQKQKPAENPGGRLRAWWKLAHRDKYVSPKNPKDFWGDLQKTGFASTENAVKKKLQLICGGEARAVLKDMNCIEKLLGKIPPEIKNGLIGQPIAKSNATAEIKHLDSEFNSFCSPLLFFKKLHHAAQIEAATRTYRKCLVELQEVEQGRIPIHLDVNSYFNYFLGLINESAETARVSAQLQPSPARVKTEKLKFFERSSKAVANNALQIEYVICLENEASLENPALNETLKKYFSISKNVSLFYKNRATELSAEETKMTIVLLDNRKWVFTHIWDHFGNLVNPTQHISEKDYKHFANIYEKIKLQSEPCPDTIRNQCLAQSLSPVSSQPAQLAT